MLAQSKVHLDDCFVLNLSEPCMFPPVLETYVIWHPTDQKGAEIASELVRYYQETPFTGLLGGAVETYVRSEGWRSTDDAPRPIPLPSEALLNGVPKPAIIAIVPILGMGLASTVQAGRGPWYEYLSALVQANSEHPEQVGIYPFHLDPKASAGTELGGLFNRYQALAAVDPSCPAEPREAILCRDLSQALAQFAFTPQGCRLQIFISHTKHQNEEECVPELIGLTRAVISRTRLRDFFDAQDLQPGQDWNRALRDNASTGALLALRTDLYSSREWCQREMLVAKNAGMPIVVLDALGRGENRGSFLMDHVPRRRVRRDSSGWNELDVRGALNLLVDECLKRALWNRQEALLRGSLAGSIGWWAPHAPEPTTLANWLGTRPAASAPLRHEPLRILHPDPPLGPEERGVLDQMMAISGFVKGLDLLTPSLLSARKVMTQADAFLPADLLKGRRVGISVSASADLERVGVVEEHFRLALAEIARCVLGCGGKLAYGGYLDPTGYTTLMVHEVQKYGQLNWPLLVCLAFQEHRKLPLSQLDEACRDLGLSGRIVCLDIEGMEMDPSRDRSEDAAPIEDNQLRMKALTGMRRYMSSQVDGRVLLGGKRQGFQGDIPGLMEEALIELEAGRPLFLAGGFGGISLDIARALEIPGWDWLPVRNDASLGDPRVDEGRRRLAAYRSDKPWEVLRNGLSMKENKALLTTHRPSEMAALLVSGLGRLAHS